MSKLITILVFPVVLAGCFLQPRVESTIDQSRGTNTSDQTALEPLFQAETKGGGYWRLGVIDGDFANGVAGPTGEGGYWWIAKKINGRWQIIVKTQEAISCAQLEQQKVPESIYTDKCVTDDGYTIKDYVR